MKTIQMSIGLLIFFLLLSCGGNDNPKEKTQKDSINKSESSDNTKKESSINYDNMIIGTWKYEADPDMTIFKAVFNTDHSFTFYSVEGNSYGTWRTEELSDKDLNFYLIQQTETKYTVLKNRVKSGILDLDSKLVKLK